MSDRSDNKFYNTVWIDYHRTSLETCKQLVSEGRLETAKVILDLVDKNLNE